MLRRIMQHVATEPAHDVWADGITGERPYRLRALLDWLVQENYLQLTDPVEGTFDVTERGRRLVKQWATHGNTD
jgi:stringent starvation protein B